MLLSSECFTHLVPCLFEYIACDVKTGLYSKDLIMSEHHDHETPPWDWNPSAEHRDSYREQPTMDPQHLHPTPSRGSLPDIGELAIQSPESPYLDNRLIAGPNFLVSNQLQQVAFDDVNMDNEIGDLEGTLTQSRVNRVFQDVDIHVTENLPVLTGDVFSTEEQFSTYAELQNYSQQPNASAGIAHGNFGYSDYAHGHPPAVECAYDSDSSSFYEPQLDNGLIGDEDPMLGECLPQDEVPVHSYNTRSTSVSSYSSVNEQWESRPPSAASSYTSETSETRRRGRPRKYSDVPKQSAQPIQKTKKQSPNGKGKSKKRTEEEYKAQRNRNNQAVSESRLKAKQRLYKRLYLLFKTMQTACNNRSIVTKYFPKLQKGLLDVKAMEELRTELEKLENAIKSLEDKKKNSGDDQPGPSHR